MENIKMVITEVAFVRSYGFVTGSYIEVRLQDENGIPVEGAEKIVFADTALLLETYAKACGIHRESDIHQLVGLEVENMWDIEDGYEIEYLTRPLCISDRMGVDRCEPIISVNRGEIEED